MTTNVAPQPSVKLYALWVATSFILSRLGGGWPLAGQLQTLPPSLGIPDKSENISQIYLGYILGYI
jgi:hypothetical protein